MARWPALSLAHVRVFSVPLAVAGVLAVPAALASSAPSLRTDRGCYRVGQRVELRGAGFAAARKILVTVDEVDFGTSTTDSKGGFAGPIVPGGLPANVAQRVFRVAANDGTSTARTNFTVSRSAGARFFASSGDPKTLRAPFELWGLATDGKRRPVYLHYVSPSGRARMTIAFGNTTGQCGYLRTGNRRVFPFAPSFGSWTLQFDTSRGYAHKPPGAIARIRVQISAAGADVA